MLNGRNLFYSLLACTMVGTSVWAVRIGNDLPWIALDTSVPDPHAIDITLELGIGSSQMESINGCLVTDSVRKDYRRHREVSSRCKQILDRKSVV